MPPQSDNQSNFWYQLLQEEFLEVLLWSGYSSFAKGERFPSARALGRGTFHLSQKNYARSKTTLREISPSKGYIKISQVILWGAIRNNQLIILNSPPTLDFFWNFESCWIFEPRQCPLFFPSTKLLYFFKTNYIFPLAFPKMSGHGTKCWKNHEKSTFLKNGGISYGRWNARGKLCKTSQINSSSQP